MSEPIRLGLLRLTDAAPVILAHHQGLFAARDVAVRLSIEPSWSNVADKLSYGLLDAAVMPPPLAIACGLGLRGRRVDLAVPMTLSLNGNAVTLAAAWRDGIADAPHDAARAGLSFRDAIARRRGPLPVLAVVHGFSTHDLLLRHWLAASGIDPERDVRLTVLPPAEMPDRLAAGAIDGFCAGAPWGVIAARSGHGFPAVYSAAIKPDHPEKCLAVRADWAGENPARLASLLTALAEAALVCAAPARRVMLAELLSRPEYLAVPSAVIAASLDPATGGPVFPPQPAARPNPVDARWFATEMTRWGHAPADIMEKAVNLYR